MVRYSEMNLDVMEAIQKTPSKGAYFGDLLNLGHNPVRLYNLLKSYVAQNYLTEQVGVNGNYFCITDLNRRLNIRKVICPFCGTTKRIWKDDQTMVVCTNPNCKTPGGGHKVFMIISIGDMRKGIVTRINHVD